MMKRAITLGHTDTSLREHKMRRPLFRDILLLLLLCLSTKKRRYYKDKYFALYQVVMVPVIEIKEMIEILTKIRQRRLRSGAS